MPEYLLPLSVLHAAAPGILDIIFGRDGDNENAPLWRGPVVLGDGRYVSMDWLLQQPWDIEIVHQMAALDLRVPSTATRIATLVAQGLTPEPQPVMGACVCSERGGLWSLLWRDASGYGKDASWTLDGKRCHVFDPDLTGAPFGSKEAFLSALIMAYAPRFVAAKEQK